MSTSEVEFKQLTVLLITGESVGTAEAEQDPGREVCEAD